MKMLGCDMCGSKEKESCVIGLPLKWVRVARLGIEFESTQVERDIDFCCPACFYQYCRDVLKII